MFHYTKRALDKSFHALANVLITLYIGIFRQSYHNIITKAQINKSYIYDTKNIEAKIQLTISNKQAKKKSYTETMGLLNVLKFMFNVRTVMRVHSQCGLQVGLPLRLYHRD